MLGKWPKVGLKRKSWSGSQRIRDGKSLFIAILTVFFTFPEYFMHSPFLLLESPFEPRPPFLKVFPVRKEAVQGNGDKNAEKE